MTDTRTDDLGDAAAPPANAVIDMRNIVKTYTTPSGAFVALDGVNLRVAAGECLAVVGKSGSGKSTLINLISGIDRPTAGDIIVAGVPINGLDESELAAWRGTTVGVVFQFFQLLPTLTIAENVMLPMDFCGTYPARRRQGRAFELLDRVGIADQAHKLPAALSGGQQQRAAIARALANSPPVLVADEPTGNLDSRTASAILDLFVDLSASGTTVVVVTHERDIAQRVDRTITLVDGKVQADTPGARRTSRLRVARTA